MLDGYDLDIETSDDCRLFFHGCTRGTFNLEILDHFQRRAAPSFYHLPSQRRLEFARAYSCTSLPGNHPNTDTLRFIIRKDRTLQVDDISSSIHCGHSILHTVAISYSRVFRRARTSATELNKEQLVQWQRMAGHVIKMSTIESLHHIESVRHTYSRFANSLVAVKDWVGTPLISLLKGSFLEDFLGRKARVDKVPELMRTWQSMVSFPLLQWLSELLRCGVDLLGYGRREHDIWTNTMLNPARRLDFEVTFSRWSDSQKVYVPDCLSVCLLGFDYGPAPKDWALHWEVGSQEIHEVMQVVLPNTHPVPGAWVD